MGYEDSPSEEFKFVQRRGGWILTNGLRDSTPVLCALSYTPKPHELEIWRRAEESNPHPCGATVFETVWRTIAPVPSTCR
jgi:hypothetical protein